LNKPLVVQEALQQGFWSNSIVDIEEVDEIEDDGRLHERCAKNALFVGCRHDCPCPLFNFVCDTFAAYFVAMYPADGDLKPLWLAQALTNPNLDLGHLNSI